MAAYLAPRQGCTPSWTRHPEHPRQAAAPETLRGQTAAQSASNEDSWLQARLAFTVDRNLLNFNNGPVGPAPKIVQEAMECYWTVTDLSPSHSISVLIPWI